jgi:hypothetical protein
MADVNQDYMVECQALVWWDINLYIMVQSKQSFVPTA